MLLKINAKCDDRCSAKLMDGDKIVKQTDGYVPHLGIGGGDYLEFTVDLDTGQIIGWKKPTEADLEAYVNE